MRTPFIVVAVLMMAIQSFSQTFTGNHVGNGSGLTNIPPSALSQGSASTSQALVWNGTAWVPGNPTATATNAIGNFKGTGTNTTLVGIATNGGTVLGGNYKNYNSPFSWTISIWGDSLSYGTGGQSWGTLMTNFILQSIADINAYPGQTSTYIAAQFLAAPSQYVNPTFFWMGRNDSLNVPANTNVTLSNINLCINQLTNVPSNAFVFGILVSTNDTVQDIQTITNLNAYLSNLYWPHYTDVEKLLQANGNGGATDNYYISQGWTPFSLLATGDPLHLNVAGYTIVASNAAWLLTNYVLSEPASVGAVAALATNPPLLQVGGSPSGVGGRFSVVGQQNYGSQIDEAKIIDSSTEAQGDGGAIELWGYYSTFPALSAYAILKGSKENTVNGDPTGDAILSIQSTNQGMYNIMQFMGGNSNAYVNGGLVLARTNPFSFVPSGPLAVLGNANWPGNQDLADFIDVTTMAQGVGGELNLFGEYQSGPQYAQFGRIKAYKDNATAGDLSSQLQFFSGTASQGSTLIAQMDGGKSNVTVNGTLVLSKTNQPSFTPNATLNVVGVANSPVNQDLADFIDVTTFGSGVGGEINLLGEYLNGAQYAIYGRIKASKDDATPNELASKIQFFVNTSNQGPYQIITADGATSNVTFGAGPSGLTLSGGNGNGTIQITNQSTGNGTYYAPWGHQSYSNSLLVYYESNGTVFVNTNFPILNGEATSLYPLIVEQGNLSKELMALEYPDGTYYHFNHIGSGAVGNGTNIPYAGVESDYNQTFKIVETVGTNTGIGTGYALLEGIGGSGQTTMPLYIESAGGTIDLIPASGVNGITTNLGSFGSQSITSGSMTNTSIISASSLATDANGKIIAGTGTGGGVIHVPPYTVAYTGSNVSFNVGTNNGYAQTNTYYVFVTNNVQVVAPTNGFDGEVVEIDYFQGTNGSSPTNQVAFIGTNWLFPTMVPSSVWLLPTNSGGELDMLCKYYAASNVWKTRGPLSYP